MSRVRSIHGLSCSFPGSARRPPLPSGPATVRASPHWPSAPLRVAGDYDGYILDLWGVVHDGVQPYPGVLDCMARLIEAGKRVVLLSNAPRRAADVVRRIATIGVPAELYHGVMSSGEEAWRHLKRRDDPFYAGLGRVCLHICSERDLEIRQGLRAYLCRRPEIGRVHPQYRPRRLG